MDDNKTLLTFNSIVQFVDELNQSFGGKQKSLQLYARLVEKTTLSHNESILKHITAFKTFCDTNKDAILEKKHANISDGKITYNQRVYINMTDIFSRADASERSVIWKHILKLFALIDPTSNAKKVLKDTLNTGEHVNEEQYLNNFIDKINNSVNENEDPAACVTNLMSSGMIPELIGGMTNGLQNGELDLGKLMGTVQTMMGSLSKLAQENGDVDATPDGMPDMGMMMGQMTAMMGQMNLDDGAGGGAGGNPFAGAFPQPQQPPTAPPKKKSPLKLCQIEEVEESTPSPKKKSSREKSSREKSSRPKTTPPRKKKSPSNSDEEEDVLIKTK